MILEHAILSVRHGQVADFEAAFEQARPLISSQPGFRDLSLSRSIESPDHYLLLVEWESIDAHIHGFRTSDQYRDWKRLLHHFYEPFPTVEHFTAIPSTDRVERRLPFGSTHGDGWRGDST